MKNLKLLIALLTFFGFAANAQTQVFSPQVMPTTAYPKIPSNLYGNTYTTPTNNYGTTNTKIRYQNSYVKSNGTYVQSHYKTTSNNTNRDNYSTQGNYNPHTGKSGTRAKDYSIDAYNYGQGKTIYTGPKGGQYYYNNKGNKVYVPKR